MKRNLDKLQDSFLFKGFPFKYKKDNQSISKIYKNIGLAILELENLHKRVKE